MGAALGAGHRVDLVHDHGAHGPQHFASLRRQHEVQRLGRGDEDVGRVAEHRLALRPGCVAGAHRRGDPGNVEAEAPCGHLDPGEGSAQVALDVVGERLHR